MFNTRTTAALGRLLRSAAGFSVVAGILIAGCNSDSTAPEISRLGDLSDAVGDEWEVDDLNIIPAGKVFVCTFAGDEFFDSNFSTTATGGDLIGSPFTHSMPPDCVEMWNATSTDAVDVAVTHISSPGFTLDRIAVMTGSTANSVFLEGTNTGSVSVGSDLGGMIWFKLFPGEVPPPNGGQGCTPGYWKQSQHFDSWTGYTPNQLFSSVFENAFPGRTLLEVVSLGGGGLNALGRMSVAALLNGASGGVDYDFTAADVVSQFNAVFPGTNASYETLKNRLDFLNNQGCPLN